LLVEEPHVRIGDLPSGPRTDDETLPEQIEVLELGGQPPHPVRPVFAARLKRLMLLSVEIMATPSGWHDNTFKIAVCYATKKPSSSGKSGAGPAVSR
jgi:hypothetical protein